MTATETSALHAFEGTDVVAASIEIPDAAGGLRDALAVDPVELHHGDEGIVALRWRVKKVRFDPAKGKGNEGKLARVHVFETLEAAFIDDDQLDKHIRADADRVKREVERLQGVQRLDDAIEEPDPEQLSSDAEHTAELLRAHVEGLHHSGNVVGCVACEERDADREADQRG